MQTFDGGVPIESRLMHVAIVHDDVPADARADELDVFAQAEVFESAVRKDGCTTERLPCTLDWGALQERLALKRPGLVVNLVEALGGHGRLQYLVPALLDALRIPYTGSPAESLMLTTNKLLTKRLLAMQGLPTLDWADLSGCEDGCDLPLARYILKPVSEDASVGLDDDALVDLLDARQLRPIMRARSESLGLEVFAERFVDGREFNLSVLADASGPQVLPPAEIEFVGYTPEQPRLVGYRAKWDADSYEYHHTPRRFDFPASDAPLLAELTRLSLACWRLFGLRGYARVDFRVDNAGRPWILEINANPCISPDAGFMAAVNQAGLTGEDAVRRIVADAGVDASLIDGD